MKSWYKKNRQIRQVLSKTTSLFNPQRHKWDWDQKKYLNRHLNEWRSKPEKPSEKDKGMKTMDFFSLHLYLMIFDDFSSK